MFPRLQAIEVLGNSRRWRKLAAASPSFEEEVLRACALVRGGDERIGKLPESRKRTARR